MRYTVFHQGIAKASFQLFGDAWLFAFLEFRSFTRIRGPSPFNEEETWIWVVNPPSVN